MKVGPVTGQRERLWSRPSRQLGLLSDPDGIAARVIEAQGVPLQAVRQSVTPTVRTSRAVFTSVSGRGH
jgi:hypothetical protein